MRNVVLMFGGIMLFGVILAFLDWYGRRKERRSERRPPA